MKKIAKKDQNAFIKDMKAALINLGAKPDPADDMKFHLQTRYGLLRLRIDEDNTVCYTVYGRFYDVEKAPKMQGVNRFSGKANQHIGPEVTPSEAVNLIINWYKDFL